VVTSDPISRRPGIAWAIVGLFTVLITLHFLAFRQLQGLARREDASDPWVDARLLSGKSTAINARGPHWKLPKAAS
jgi:hypothetical protein